MQFIPALMKGQTISFVSFTSQLNRSCLRVRYQTRAERIDGINAGARKKQRTASHTYLYGVCEGWFNIRMKKYRDMAVSEDTAVYFTYLASTDYIVRSERDPPRGTKISTLAHCSHEILYCLEIFDHVAASPHLTYRACATPTQGHARVVVVYPVEIDNYFNRVVSHAVIESRNDRPANRMGMMRGEYGAAPEFKGGGSGSSPRKPVDRWNRPARFPNECLYSLTNGRRKPLPYHHTSATSSLRTRCDDALPPSSCSETALHTDDVTSVGDSGRRHAALSTSPCLSPELELAIENEQGRVADAHVRTHLCRLDGTNVCKRGGWPKKGHIDEGSGRQGAEALHSLQPSQAARRASCLLFLRWPRVFCCLSTLRDARFHRGGLPRHRLRPTHQDEMNLQLQDHLHHPVTTGTNKNSSRKHQECGTQAVIARATTEGMLSNDWKAGPFLLQHAADGMFVAETLHREDAERWGIAILLLISRTITLCSSLRHSKTQGAVVAERLDCSPLNKANRVQSPAGSFLIFASSRRVYSRISRFPRPCIPAPLHSHLISHSSALKTSLLRAGQISQFNNSNGRCAAFLFFPNRPERARVGRDGAAFRTAPRANVIIDHVGAAAVESEFLISWLPPGCLELFSALVVRQWHMLGLSTHTELTDMLNVADRRGESKARPDYGG
ncbi:hypothetical protein PR048_010150 [Dryococelus australis]|uniref:Uncharacterized protein n=1 Tax=Dryococelus australis TaxID=614101 RepID=A0ABQ9I1X3_9NEOP|nr:hypothetical protein PR048_010150 [Dryococelus australis]